MSPDAWLATLTRIADPGSSADHVHAGVASLKGARVKGHRIASKGGRFRVIGAKAGPVASKVLAEAVQGVKMSFRGVL